MNIYHYNSDGFLVGASEADESPLEPGVFLIPALTLVLILLSPLWLLLVWPVVSAMDSDGEIQ